MREEIVEYLENNILPLYDNNIGGHGKEHILSVVQRSFEIVNEFNLDVDLNLVYTIAIFHDVGYKIDPDKHEELSAILFKKDINIKNFFNDKEIQIITEAIIDHRASLEYEARNIYGKIVSSADRETSVENMLKRSLLYQSEKHKEENPSIEDVISYSYKKLFSKYGKEGYAKMYYKDKKYLDYLEEIQRLLNNKKLFFEREKRIAKYLKI
jgi:uncharacterized protein